MNDLFFKLGKRGLDWIDRANIYMAQHGISTLPVDPMVQYALEFKMDHFYNKRIENAIGKALNNNGESSEYKSYRGKA